MPCVSKNQESKLTKFVDKFGSHIFQTDGKTLFCRLCSFTIAHERKSQIEQHIGTIIHRSNVQKEGGQLRFPEMKHAETYPKELCNAFRKADIPLFKLNTIALSKFLSKYTKLTTPSERTTRRLLNEIYDETIIAIQIEVGNSPIYIEVEETTDSTGLFNINIKN